LQVTDISTWCGKLIYPVIALESEAGASVYPTIKLGIKSKSFTDIFQKSDLSPIIQLGNLSKLSAINFTKSVTGGGGANLQVSLLQDNTWSDFMPTSDAVGQNCSAVQLKALLTVTSTSGSSTAKITSAEIVFVKNADEIASTVSTIYFQAQDFSEDLATAYILIKHSYLGDNDLKVFVAFDDLPLLKSETLGTATGSQQNFALEGGIDFDTLEVFADGIKIFNFTLNAQSKSLSLVADSGKIITISYKYNLQAENWLECEKQFTILDTNTYTGSNQNQYASRFVYRLETPEKSKVAKVKIQNTAGSEPIKIYKVGAGFSI